MGSLNKILNRIASYPDVQMSRIDKMEFKIIVYGELMESFMRFGEIQEEIKKELSDDYNMHTYFGDGQEAFIRFEKKEA